MDAMLNAFTLTVLEYRFGVLRALTRLTRT